ncbi:MAG: hypothetical protein K6B38_13450 [Ruminococcus sp.]|nr:hypothetical protein [Ruminococcus sp.]
MSNLMKAEWFRVRHSGNTLTMVITMCFIIVLMQFVGDAGLSITAEMLFTHSSIGVVSSVLMITAMITGTFNNRVANYEVMKGTPPMLSILSKTFMAFLMVTAFYYIPSIILIMIFDSGKLTIPMILLFLVCIAKVVVMAVSICIIFKDAAASVLFMFLFMFQTAPLLLLQNLLDKDMSSAAAWFTTTQMSIIGSQTIYNFDILALPLDSSHIELKVILSFILLTAVMFLLAYKSLKEKWEIRLTPQQI